MLEQMLPSVSRWLAVPLLAGALASSAPVVRWCPMPWEGVPPAVYLRCSLFSASLPAPRGASCADAASCPLAHSVGRPACDGESCPLAGRSRAFCLSDPGLASVWRPHVHAPRNPSAPVAVLIAALTMTAPAPAISHARGLEPEARPPSADPRSRPPVRAPPGIASFV